VLGLSKAHATTHGYDWSSSFRVPWSLAFVTVLCIGAYAFGLPDQARSRRGAVLGALGATVSASVLISVAQLVVGSAVLPRVVVLGSVAVLTPWYVLCWRFAGDARARAADRDRVLVVADDDEVAVLTAELERAPERAAVVVGALRPAGAVSTSFPPCRPVLDLARAECASVVVLGRDAQSEDDVVAQAAMLHEEGVRIRTLSLFYEQWLGKLPIGELERVSLLFDIGELHQTRYARVKRLVDLALAAVGAVVLTLLVPFVVLGNLVANRGPLFYRQTRVGQGGRTFDMTKFRTMRVDVEGSEWTAEHDVRVTPFGRVLRRTHLDELPQVLNVLRGELSIVGPRPEQPQVVAELADKIPFYRLRHLVRPGLTGWAQVKFRYASSEADALEKLQYEFFYLRRQSLSLDLRIVGRTLREIAGRCGR
jgi:lipopolysaccharide/colanic/teichoic acid biosynthesis glycosyltransferase